MSAGRKKLTPAMAELLAAMQSGVRVHFIPWDRWQPAHYFRSDTMKSCTKQVDGLIARGLAKHVSDGHGRNSRVELTPAPPTGASE